MRRILILALTLMMCCSALFGCDSVRQHDHDENNNEEQLANNESDNKKQGDDNTDPTIVIETPPDGYDYIFDSYDGLKQALFIPSAEKYSALRAEQQNYGEIYKSTLSAFASNDISLYVPQYNESCVELRNEEGYSNVSFMTCELYNLPWIWYHCKVDEYDLTVKISYLDVLDSEELSAAASYTDVLALIAPDAPSPSNYQQYSSYKTIYEEEIRLADGRSVTAMFSVLKDSSKVYVMFYLDGVLFSLYADNQLFSDAFWEAFNVALY